MFVLFFFSSRRRHTRCGRDWSSDVCSSDLMTGPAGQVLIRDLLGEQGVDFVHVAAGELGDLRLLDELMQGLVAAANAAQIGRASCRERVWMSGGAVAVQGKDVRWGSWRAGV